jgi:hypothetical protein
MNAQTRAFRTKKLPRYFLYGLAGFFALMCAIMAFAATGADKDATRGLGIGLGIPFGLLAFWMYRMGRKLSRAEVTISPERLFLRTHEFKVWGLRRLKQADLAWNQVTGVEVFETPNPYAPGGAQREFVIHTNLGRFSVSNVVFPDAAEIADLVAARAGSVVGNVQKVAEPIVVDRPRDRLGILAMRAFGWLSIICGGLFAIGAATVASRGGPNALSTAAKVGMMSGILISTGLALRRFKFNHPTNGSSK